MRQAMKTVNGLDCFGVEEFQDYWRSVIVDQSEKLVFGSPIATHPMIHMHITKLWWCMIPKIELEIQIYRAGKNLKSVESLKNSMVKVKVKE